MTVRSGYLRARQTLTLDDECQCDYDFECLDGQFICDVSPLKDIPINAPIEAHFSHNEIVFWESLPIMARTDWARKDIALIYVLGEGAQVSGDIVERTRKEAIEIENFYNRTNDGKWEYVRVTPYVIENRTSRPIGLSFPFKDDSVILQMEEQWPGRSSQHNYFHGRGGFAPGINGHAYLNSNKAWSYGGGVSVVKHEQGHNFGCMHSSTERNEYGDPACIMAKSTCGFNGPQTVNLDMIDHASIEEASDCHFIVPIECDQFDLFPGECMGVTVTVESERKRYFITARKPKHQSVLGVSNLFEAGTLFVHQVRYSGDTFGAPTYLTDVPIGTKMVVGGREIHNTGTRYGTIRMTVNDADQEEFPKRPAVLPGYEVTQSHEGIWHNTKYDAQGIDLWVIPHRGQVVGYWFHYHPQGPHSDASYRTIEGREWYMLDGRIKNGYISFDVIKTDPSGDDYMIGRATMKFTDGPAVFKYYTSSLGRGHMLLNKLTPAKERDDLTGIWETGEQEGYAVSKYDGQYVAYYFGYDLQERDWAIYSGENAEALGGLRIASMFKSPRKLSEQNLPSLDLVEMTSGATRILD